MSMPIMRTRSRSHAGPKIEIDIDGVAIDDTDQLDLHRVSPGFRPWRSRSRATCSARRHSEQDDNGKQANRAHRYLLLYMTDAHFGRERGSASHGRIRPELPVPTPMVLSLGWRSSQGADSDRGRSQTAQKPATLRRSPPVLEMRNISKRFGATQALSGVSLQLRRGEVHALLGENGAGKSTLIKIMTGVQSTDIGEILLDGQPVHLSSAQDAQRYGIAAMYQEPMIFPDLSVAENIFIGHRNRGHIVDRRKMEKEATEVLSRLGVQIGVDEPARGLTLAEQQTVEIAKAISLDARILIMDEPTSSLSAHEVRRLFRIIDNLRSQGVAILFISHRMDEVFEISDTVTILRDGQWISTRPRAELTPRMAIRDMVGRQVVEIFRRERRTPGDVRLKVDWAGPDRCVRGHLVRDSRRGSAWLCRPGRRAAHRCRAGALRHRAGRTRHGHARWATRQGLESAAGDESGHRL